MRLRRGAERVDGRMASVVRAGSAAIAGLLELTFDMHVFSKPICGKAKFIFPAAAARIAARMSGDRYMTVTRGP
jgi:hypothetical protein